MEGLYDDLMEDRWSHRPSRSELAAFMDRSVATIRRLLDEVRGSMPSLAGVLAGAESMAQTAKMKVSRGDLWGAWLMTMGAAEDLMDGLDRALRRGLVMEDDADMVESWIDVLDLLMDDMEEVKPKLR